MTFAERLRNARKARQATEQPKTPETEPKGSREAITNEKGQKKNEGASEIIERIRGDLAKLEEMLRSE